MAKRRKFTDQFKARVALEALRGDRTIQEIAARHQLQPITRDGLKDIFGREISRDLIGRLHARALIGTGPRSPRRGAPYSAHIKTAQVSH